MEDDELYLSYIHGNMDRVIMGCPCIVPSATVYQSIMMISIIYKSALAIESTLMEAGDKMNDHAVEVFRREIGRHYFEIMLFKAGIEN